MFYVYLLTETFFVGLDYQAIDYPLEREDTMSSIEKKEHVSFVILMISSLCSNVISYWYTTNFPSTLLSKAFKPYKI